MYRSARRRFSGALRSGPRLCAGSPAQPSLSCIRETGRFSVPREHTVLDNVDFVFSREVPPGCTANALIVMAFVMNESIISGVEVIIAPGPLSRLYRNLPMLPVTIASSRINNLIFNPRNLFISRRGPTILATARIIAWIIVTGLITVSLVPASLRPGTGVSHNLEHFGSFLLAGIVWCIAYADRLVLWLGTMPVLAGGVELLQIFVPGRHARLSDFAVDALGGCVGILITFLVAARYRALVSPSVRGLPKGDP